MPTLDYDRAAIILVEAAYFGDPVTAKKWEVTERTIRNYRARLSEDDQLSAFFQVKKSEFDNNWAGDMSASIRASIDFLRRASQKADPKDPDAIHAIAGALKIMAEVTLTKEILDARLGRNNGPDGAENRPLASGSENQTE